MALTGLKKDFAARGAAISLGAVAALSPLMSAYAQEAQVVPAATTATTTSTRNVEQVDLPVVDLSAVENSHIRGEAMAIKASGDFAIVKVHSNDPEVIESVDSSLRNLVRDGYPRVGMVIAQGENGFDNTGELYLLAENGEPKHEYENIGSGTERRLSGSIKQIYPNIWRRPEPQASLQTAGPATAYE